MENPQTKPSAVGSFLKGFLNSAGLALVSSACLYGIGLAFFPGMLGLHAGVTIAEVLVTKVLPSVMWMMSSFGAFGGIMAVKRDMDEAKAVEKAATTNSTVIERRHETPMMVPMVGVSADRAETPEANPATTSWADRTGGGHRDRIETILANGSLSNKDRASALLAEREATAAAQAQRG